MSRKDADVWEQVAQLIENSPSECLLQKAWTDEQRNYWHKLREKNSLVAQGLRAKFIPGYRDTITIAEEEKKIDKLEGEAIWLLVDHYKILWEIVQIVEPYVNLFHSLLRYVFFLSKNFQIQLPKQFEKIFGDILSHEYPFKSAYELFVAIVKESNEDFDECLKPYNKISIDKGEQGLKQVKGFFDEGMPNGFYPILNPIEQKQLKNNFSWENFTVTWMVMTICVSQFATKWKPLLKRKLLDYNDLVCEMCNLGITACRKRDSRTWQKRRSFAWIKGRRVYASKAGGVYPQP